MLALSRELIHGLDLEILEIRIAWSSLWREDHFGRIDQFCCSNNFTPSVPQLPPDTHGPGGLTWVPPSWLDHLKKAIFYGGWDKTGGQDGRSAALAHRSPLGKVRSSYLDPI